MSHGHIKILNSLKYAYIHGYIKQNETLVETSLVSINNSAHRYRLK